MRIYHGVYFPIDKCYGIIEKDFSATNTYLSDKHDIIVTCNEAEYHWLWKWALQRNGIDGLDNPDIIPTEKIYPLKVNVYNGILKTGIWENTTITPNMYKPEFKEIRQNNTSSFDAGKRSENKSNEISQNNTSSFDAGKRSENKRYESQDNTFDRDYQNASSFLESFNSSSDDSPSSSSWSDSNSSSSYDSGGGSSDW